MTTTNGFYFNHQVHATAQDARAAQIQCTRTDIDNMRRRLARRSGRRAANLAAWIEQAEAELAALIEHARRDGTLPEV